MPTTVVTGPDGKKYNVEHPSGIQQEIIDYARANAGNLAPAEPERLHQGTYGPLMDGLIEGIATVGSGVAGGIAGAVGGLWDAVTGEDYETARETQDRISGALTWNPVSDGGKEVAASIGEAMDNPLF